MHVRNCCSVGSFMDRGAGRYIPSISCSTSRGSTRPEPFCASALLRRAYRALLSDLSSYLASSASSPCQNERASSPKVNQETNLVELHTIHFTILNVFDSQIHTSIAIAMIAYHFSFWNRFVVICSLVHKCF